MLRCATIAVTFSLQFSSFFVIIDSIFTRNKYFLLCDVPELNHPSHPNPNLTAAILILPVSSLLRSLYSFRISIQSPTNPPLEYESCPRCNTHLSCTRGERKWTGKKIVVKNWVIKNRSKFLPIYLRDLNNNFLRESVIS